MENVAELLTQAAKRHQSGDLEGALPLYHQAVRLDPGQSKAWYLLGAACQSLGRLDEAADHLQQSLRLRPDNADAHNFLGVNRARQGKLDEAVLSFRQALHLQPTHAEAARNLKEALRKQTVSPKNTAGQPQATAKSNGDPRLLVEQGRTFRKQGKFDESEASFRHALRLKANDPEAHNGLGITLALRGKLSDAETCFREAIRLNPSFASAHTNLGNVYKEQRKLTDAQACYEQALRLNPDHVESHGQLGTVLFAQGQAARAVGCYREALRLRPDYLYARFGLCFAQLPILYESAAEIARCRENYRRELEEVIGDFPYDRPEVIAETVETGIQQTFYLPYQGQSDRDLQALYGQFVCRIMAARYSQWAAPLPLQPPAPGERIRVGILSAFFYRHSNWKIPIRGWVENLDRGRFELFGFYLGRTKDAETVNARRIFDHFTEDVGALEEWCKVIRGHNLHILITPETGMETTTVKLAALRLAPIQCVSWGHPNTSGLPTIDYFLSSDLMEPPDGQQHYTEELVRLANLSVHYDLLETPAGQFDLSRFGLRPGHIRYLCCQSLFKYLPQYDAVFPRIAAQVPEAKFLFVSLPRNAQQLAERFRRRIHAAFARAGLDGSRHVVLLPHLDSRQYRAVNESADVFLDSIGWSGCNSTLEALSCGLPVVTFPGALMRGRHSLAILQMMGVTDTIAADLDDYVAKAVRLGRDPGERLVIRQMVGANLGKVFQDQECIRSLEAFLEQAVARRLAEHAF